MKNLVNKNESETLSKKAYLDDQLLTAHGYLQGAIPAIQKMVDELYQGPQSGTWHSLSQFLEGIEWLTQFIDEIQQNKHLYSSWQSEITVESSFKEHLENMVEAIHNSDPVLIADIVSYELLDVLKALSTDIEKTIKAEVPANELH